MSNHFCHPALHSDISEFLLVVEMNLPRDEYNGQENGVRARGHLRSASHGGIGGSTLSPTSSSSLIAPVSSRPSALKQRGHQRAFSQGMIETESSFTKSHTRIGSKADFILPPTHRESSGSSCILTQRKSGHSRQASRSESIYTLRNNAPPPKWQQMLCSWFQFPTGDDLLFRTIVPNHMVPQNLPNHLHPNGRCVNRIRTTKYTLLSFLPKNLLEQFHRFANLYFIFIVLLNWVPSINAFGKEIAMIPVMFVLGVTGIKDLFEDRRRHASDKRINNSFCRVYYSGDERYKKMLWKEIKVGDIVHLSNNECIPADILLLRSSDPQGLCYIDTCNLDGETNLKMRQVVRGFVEKQNEFYPSSFRSVIEVDCPTTKIYRFHGAIIHPSGERVPVATDNLLLRDCVLKNTDFVEGIVVYAGHETKAMLNNNGPRYKRSSLEIKINSDIMWCVVILLVLCSLGATGSWLHLCHYTEYASIHFILTTSKPAFEGFLTFWTFIIILQVMIPLSLYVTVEVAKLLQVYHINNNIELHDSETNKKVECRAMNITEELGQIQYIFSDKTGTLTENKMLFRRCSINGVDYNHPPAENTKTYNNTGVQGITLNSNLLAELGKGNENGGQKVREFLLILALCNTVVVARHPHHDSMDSSGIVKSDETPKNNPKEHPVEIVLTNSTENVQNSNSRYRRLAESRSVTPSPTSLVSDTTENGPTHIGPVSRATALSPIASSPESSPGQVTTIKYPLRPKLLNVPMQNILNVVSRKHKNGVASHSDTAHPKPIFEAESPDELTLVETAYAYNVRLLSRLPFSAAVSIDDDVTVEYEILHVLAFDSARKCMSIIVKDASTKTIIMYTKGADSTIFSRLAPIEDFSSQQLLFKTQQHLNSYARLGLRVLVMAKRLISEEEYEKWAKQVEEAQFALDRDHKVQEAYASIENNLTLVGATGIEDKLQEGVPETITSLRAAGIVVWVLTGDKPETAINIAYSARLFVPNMELLKLFAETKQIAESTILFYLNNITRSNNNTDDVISPNTSNANGIPRKKGLVIDGKTLTYILDRRSNLQVPFLELSRHCTSVLACRTTPLQKAYIVRIVKEHMQMRTLAIGDGANDVSMIQAADVGIGVSGQEGMQACMASDFTVPRFKYVEQLILVHGHWAYDRLARMVLYFFYKNTTFVFLIFFYQFYSGFSGTVMIDQMYHMLYNLVFTSLPPLTIGVYDQDVSKQVLITRPGLYRKGRLNLSYRRRSFWITTLDSFYQSIVILFISAQVYTDTNAGLWEFGTTIVTSCMLAMLVQAALETKTWTILQIGAMIVSLGGYLLFSLVYNSICMQCHGLPSNVWVLDTTLFSLEFWIIVFLSTVAAILPRITIQVLSTIYWPSDSTRAIIEEHQTRSGDNLIVSWSRSTSTSSIYRTNEIPPRDGSMSVTSNTLTAVG